MIGLGDALMWINQVGKALSERWSMMMMGRVEVAVMVVAGATCSIHLSKLMTSALAESSQFLCVVEQAAGLRYDKQPNAWRPQAFGIYRKYSFAA